MLVWLGTASSLSTSQPNKQYKQLLSFYLDIDIFIFIYCLLIAYLFKRQE